ncbi:unnamed protein product, partial [Musa banksii]
KSRVQASYQPCLLAPKTKCAGCNKTVYPLEKQKAMRGESYHKTCKHHFAQSFKAKQSDIDEYIDIYLVLQFEILHWFHFPVGEGRVSWELKLPSLAVPVLHHVPTEHVLRYHRVRARGRRRGEGGGSRGEERGRRGEALEDGVIGNDRQWH